MRFHVCQPQGFEKLDKTGNNLVRKLNKLLYGLKQSGRNWHNLLHNFLIDLGFVYVKNSEEGLGLF